MTHRQVTHICTCLQLEDEKVANIKRRGVQPESNTSVWACLSRLVNFKDGSQLCNEAIAAQVQILFAAGFETTAHTITWALFELAANPELQVTPSNCTHCCELL